MLPDRWVCEIHRITCFRWLWETCDMAMQIDQSHAFFIHSQVKTPHAIRTQRELEDKLLATHSCNCRRPARLFLMVSSHLQEISSTGNCGKLIESWLDVKAYAATAGPSTNCLEKGTSALFVAVLFLIFTNVGSVAIRLDSLYKQLQENRGCSCPHLPLDQLTSWLASCHVSPGISRLGWAQKPPQQRPLPCRRSKWAAGHLPSTLQGKLGCAQPCTVHRMNSWP